MPNELDFYKLEQRSNGIWYIRWYDSASNTVGSQRISTRTADRREAETFRAQYIAGLKNIAPPEQPTINWILNRYREERAVKTRSLYTIDNHMKTLKPFFGDLLPEHISNNVIAEYAESRTVSAGTILRALGVLKAALHYAEGNRWIPIQPQFSMPVKAPPPKDLWLTREQVSLLIETAKSPHISLFIKLAVSTAARSGAILELTWDRVDFEKRLIDLGQGHGNKRRSVVPMHDQVYEALLEAKELRQTDHVIEFMSKPLKSIKKAFRDLCKNCGVKASPHVLRHTAATWMVMAGVPLSEVARVLGDSERTVERVYGKHAPDYLRRAVSALNFKPSLSL
jgi:integrase